MKKGLTMTVLVALGFLFINVNTVNAQSREVERVEEAIEVFEKIMAIPEKGIPPSLLKRAYGIAIIPRVIKVGFIFGGRYGRGLIVIRDEKGGLSNPIFISFTGGSVGWQIGAQSTDVVLVFKTSKGVENLSKAKVTLGVDASIAAGPVGRHAEAGTDIQLQAEIYSYSRSRGFFGGVSLEGSVLQVDREANDSFYSGREVSINNILKEVGVKVPPVSERLKQRLQEYAIAKE